MGQAQTVYAVGDHPVHDAVLGDKVEPEHQHIGHDDTPVIAALLCRGGGFLRHIAEEQQHKGHRAQNQQHQISVLPEGKAIGVAAQNILATAGADFLSEEQEVDEEPRRCGKQQRRNKVHRGIQ